MQFQFDPNQPFQITAIEAIADLFQGQPRDLGTVDFTLGSLAAAVPNRLELDHEVLLSNLSEVQRRNRISPDGALKEITGLLNDEVSSDLSVTFPNFSVEQETGTGKTYVYLRTMLELNRRYGMRKFIVVVPSVAVREGVLKSLRITERHLRELYDNTVYRYYVYDSTNLTQVRQFALSDAVEMMIMTIDSFNKSGNVIRQSTDRLQGDTPLHLIQAARPILVLDEPQNYESTLSIKALATLNPLFALRYSATHKNPYNIVYRLTPYEAYRQNLVKKIEVDSVVSEDSANAPYLRLESMEAKGSKVTAKLTVHKLSASGSIKPTSVTVRGGDSLEIKTGRVEYQGFEVEEINLVGGFVRFANQIEVQRGEDLGSDRDAIFEAQIRHTVEEHFKKQKRLKAKGVKVLSLFFIDRVANYAAEDGIIRLLFNKAFDEVKRRYPDWKDLDSSTVQAGYFASKRKKGGGLELVESTSGESAADAEAYDLIMKDKESLLSFASDDDDDDAQRRKQVAFLFSHSALREGWDNPNVFQICTLNQTASSTKKRQEIGRGIRLAVNQSGERVHDEQVNILTVIANESYRSYVLALQTEIAEEYRDEIEARMGKSLDDLSAEERATMIDEYGEGIIPPAPQQAGKNKSRLRKQRALSEEFRALWDRIKQRTRYRVTIDTDRLLDDVVKELNGAVIDPPRVVVTKTAVSVTDENAFEALQMSGAKTLINLAGRYPLPNLVEIMSSLMEHTTPPVKLTRRTLLEVFKRSSPAIQQGAMDNPHEYAAVAVRILKTKLADQLVDGIQYEKIDDFYEMQKMLDDAEVELFSKYIVDTNGEHALYDRIGCDSEVERDFVKQLDARSDVKVYVKLPRWFTVPTPVGEYNPDWAIYIQPEEDSKPVLYFVAETKSTLSGDMMRPGELRKIRCAAAHFGSQQSHIIRDGALDGVEYRVVTTAAELPS